MTQLYVMAMSHSGAIVTDESLCGTLSIRAGT